MRDNTVDIFVEWFRTEGCSVQSGTVLAVNDKFLDLISLPPIFWK